MLTAAVFGTIRNGRAYADENCLKHLIISGIKPKVLTGERATECANKYDCLVLIGGNDIDPTLYGQVPWQNISYDRAMCLAEMEYIHAFVNAKKAILGICRGIQSINVAFGGTLIQDIPSMLGLVHANCTATDCEHEIKISKSSTLHKSFGLRAIVNSKHHQCIHTLGRGLFVAAASHDGIIEAIESIENKILAVQWNPEKMSGNTLFDHFLNEYVKN